MDGWAHLRMSVPSSPQEQSILDPDGLQNSPLFTAKRLEVKCLNLSTLREDEILLFDGLALGVHTLTKGSCYKWSCLLIRWVPRHHE